MLHFGNKNVIAAIQLASLHSSEELFLARRLEYVGGGELKELDPEPGPLLGAVGDEEELVALVHRDHAPYVLLLYLIIHFEKLPYRVSHLLADLGWVDFDLGPAALPLLPNSHRPKQNRADTQNPSQPHPVHEQMGHPVVGSGL